MFVAFPLELSPERYGITSVSQDTVDVTGYYLYTMFVAFIWSCPLRDMVSHQYLRTLLMSLVLSMYYVCSIPMELSPERYGITSVSQDSVDVTGIIRILCL